MGDVMGPLSYPPWREGETLPPYPPLQILPPPPCESEVQGVLRTERLWYSDISLYTIKRPTTPLWRRCTANARDHQGSESVYSHIDENNRPRALQCV